MKRQVGFIYLIVIGCVLSGVSSVTDQSTINKCCSNGINHPSEKSCSTNIQNYLTFVHSYLRDKCRSKIVNCCLQHRDNVACKAGSDAAIENKPCRNRNRKFQSCCLQCEIGIKLAKDGKECEIKVDDRNSLENRALLKCCEERKKILLLNSNEDDENDDDYSDEESGFVESVLNGNDSVLESCDVMNYCDHSCIIVGGQQKCLCIEGYRLEGDGKSCRRMDLLTQPAESCDDGFYLNDLGYCEDINECEIANNACGNEMKCVNTRGSFLCTPKKICMKGFKFNDGRRSCDDINECIEMRNPCNFATHYCNNTIGGFICSEKFEPHRVRFATITTPRSYQTTRRMTTRFYIPNEIRDCSAGYKLNSNGRCDDINECEIIKPCLSHQGCINLHGSYRCEQTQCPSGHEHNGTNCIRINYCERHPCPVGYDCVNLATNRQCIYKQCESGYQKFPNGECVDIDECITKPCHNGNCINKPGSFECHCNRGFTLEGNNVCRDVDECKEGIHSCEQKCYNTFGSYRCSCNSGYKLNNDGRSCDDIDECEENGKSLCIGNCVNNIGSYSCECAEGFERNGIYCLDIDECKNDSHLCDNEDDYCLNTIGSYKCMKQDCPKGYKLVDDGMIKYCIIMTPCGYKNDDEICHQPRTYRRLYVSYPANCSVQHLGRISFESYIDFDPQIKHFSAYSNENVKLAEKSDFVINKVYNGYDVEILKRLSGPQEIQLNIVITSYDKHTEREVKNQHEFHVIISKYPFKNYPVKIMKY